MYPTPDDPAYGVFVASQMESIAQAGASVNIVFINGRRGKWQYVRALREVGRLASASSYDVVHAHYGLTGFVAALHSVPLVVSFCGDDLLGTPDGHGGITVKSRLGIGLSRFAARRSDAAICKSEQLRQALPESVRSRAQVIGNGVDTARFHPGERAAARQRLGLDPGERLVLFPHSRRQAAVKRFDLAQAAAERLPNCGVRARLWVVNDVAPEGMPDYYRAADCMLVTSDHEGSPNTVKEALCCDLPVVSVDVGDVRRWFALAPGCRIVERDPAAIARGLAEVLGGPGRVAGVRVRDEIGLPAVAQRVLAVYRDAMERRPQHRLIQ
jgi:glycosyltransferase involved in cell wall biosynthesis